MTGLVFTVWSQDSSTAGSPTEDTVEMLEDSGDDRGSAGEEIITSGRESDSEIVAKNPISVSVRKPSVIVDDSNPSHSTIRTTVSKNQHSYFRGWPAVWRRYSLLTIKYTGN